MAHSRGRGRVIDFKSWSAIPSFVLNSASGIQLVAGLSFAAPATILRCRGDVMFALDATKQVGDQAKVAIGLGIVSTDAFTVGGSAVPDPAGEADYPWLYWTERTLVASVAAGEESQGSSVDRFQVDTKAMRKVRPGETLTWITQFVDLVGAPVTDLFFSQTRVLVGTG